jgi:hypothetical protein
MSEGTTITVRSIGKPTGPQTRSDYHDLISGDLVEWYEATSFRWLYEATSFRWLEHAGAVVMPALVFEIRSSSSWVRVLDASEKTFRIPARLLKKVS